MAGLAPALSMAIELSHEGPDSLLSPALSSRGGEGEAPGISAQILLNSMAVEGRGEGELSPRPSRRCGVIPTPRVPPVVTRS